ncbi:MAG: sugar phosphate nucleotidyltransferase [Bacillota bacterium]
MAGGKGTRLRPLTCGIPKPMVPILNKPVMEYTIALLKKYNITDIAITMAYLPSVITDYFGTGEKWGVNIHYYTEEVPLGTGGSVKNADDFIDGTLLVISGDALTDLNIHKAIHYHRNKNAKATLVLRKEPVPIEYGVIITDRQGRIVRFLEKPSWGEVFSDTINTGIYILEPEALNYYKKGDNFDFSKDLFPQLLRDDVPMFGYVMDDYWCDIGDIKSYKQTQFDILNKKVKIDIQGTEISNGIWIGEGTIIDHGVTVKAPAYIGNNCSIKRGAIIDAYTVIGDYSRIERNVHLKKSIIWGNTIIGEGCNCSGAMICSNAVTKNNVNIYENAVIGEGSQLSHDVIVKPEVKIWPHKSIEDNTIVQENLVWGTKASKTLFGFRDISGEINIDITPEFASKLGASFSSILKQDPTIVVSGDGDNASNVIKRSLISGILSTGAAVIDIDHGIIPMNRFAVRFYKAKGGIHVRTDCENNNKVYIEFMDKTGANISRSMEREVENVLNREDYKRCNASYIKEVIEANNFSAYFLEEGVRLLQNLPTIIRKRPIFLLSSKSEKVSKLAENLLGKIGCHVIVDKTVEKYKSVSDYLIFLSRKVVNSKADIGVFISEDGENLILVDEFGREIDNEKYMAFVSLLVMKKGPLKSVILPYISPKSIENMIQNQDVEIIRTKSSPACVMSTMLNHDSEQEDLILQYILSFNAIWALGLITDFLAEKNMKLSDLVQELPQIYYKKQEIPCEWKDKGRVIRQLIGENRNDNIEMFEGIKIHQDKGWALIVPDSERPVFNVYTEGFTEEYAQELSVIYSKKVKELLENQRQ